MLCFSANAIFVLTHEPKPSSLFRLLPHNDQKQCVDWNELCAVFGFRRSGLLFSSFYFLSKSAYWLECCYLISKIVLFAAVADIISYCCCCKTRATIFIADSHPAPLYSIHFDFNFCFLALCHKRDVVVVVFLLLFHSLAIHSLPLNSFFFCLNCCCSYFFYVFGSVKSFAVCWLVIIVLLYAVFFIGIQFNAKNIN